MIADAPNFKNIQGIFVSITPGQCTGFPFDIQGSPLQFHDRCSISHSVTEWFLGSVMTLIRWKIPQTHAVTSAE